MKHRSASQLVTIAAACTTNSPPEVPSGTFAGNVPSVSEHLPGVTTCSAAAAASQSSLRGGESVGKLCRPDYWRKCFEVPSFSALPVRGGGSSDDKTKQSAHKKESAKDKQKTEPSNIKSKKSKKKKQKPSSKREKVERKDDVADASSCENESTSSQNSRSYPNQRVVEEIVKHTDYYEILGIPEDRKGRATKLEIQKAYRKRAVQVHPDKTGGDRRAFDKVAESFEVLSDDSKRQLYDRYGKQGLEHGEAVAGGMPGPFQDMFQSMFQQAGQRQSYGRTRQNYTMRYQIEVTLEDLYNGTTQDVVVTAPTTERRREKSVQVQIPKGSIAGQSIVLSGEMDFANDTPGDLIFVLSQRPHPVFTRKGHDLAMELKISLQEAICGFRREIRHLDGSSLWIGSVQQDGNDAPHIIQTGEVQVLKGRGMPKKNNADDEYGDLYIQFHVEMPNPQRRGIGDSLSKDEMNELGRLLSKLQNGRSCNNEVPGPNDEVHQLQVASSRDFGRASGPVHLEDEEHAGHHEDNPFSSQFFQGAGGGSSFYFGSSFAGRPDDDDSNVQCHQM